MKTEHRYSACKDQLAFVLSFFSRVDSKLSVILALDTGMLAVLASDAPPVKDLTWTMLTCVGLTLTLIGTSVVFLYRGGFPSLKGGKASLVYFREIAGRTEHQYIEQFKEQSEDDLVNDLLGQVWRNSEILTAKFFALKVAFLMLALAMIPWLVGLALFATNARPGGLKLFH